MVKFNYLSRREQEIWDLTQDKEILDKELLEQIFPEYLPNKILFNLAKKGFLKRARRDLYYNPLKLSDFNLLALKIRSGYIGLSSALKYYGLLDYEDFTIMVMTTNFQKKRTLPGTKYTLNYIPLKHLFCGYEKKESIYVSSLEKTFFDCFLKPNYVGYTNLTKALYQTKIDWQKFLGFYETANNSICQRTGYILDLMKKTKLKVPVFVLDYLLKRVKSPVKLGKGKSLYNKKWKIEDGMGEKNILSWWYT